MTNYLLVLILVVLQWQGKVFSWPPAARQLNQNLTIRAGWRFMIEELLFRQTYYGVLDLLKPLVRTKKASILPMQEAMPGLPRLIEICPASTLKAHNCYSSYKGRRGIFISAQGL